MATFLLYVFVFLSHIFHEVSHNHLSPRKFFQTILSCVKSKSKHVNSLEMTEHDMAFIHAPHAYSCIHNRYPKIGDSYSDPGLSSEVQLNSYCHMLRDQLWNNSEWYIQALARGHKFLRTWR